MHRTVNFLFSPLVVLLLLSSYPSQIGWSQDFTFSQFYAAPLHVNPAMIGFSEAPRLNFNVRDQLSSFDHAFVTAGLSYDQYFHKYRSAIGFTLVGDRAGSLVNTTFASAYYAYQLPISGKLNCHVGVQGSFTQQSLDFGEFIYPDQINAATGLESFSATGELPLNQASTSYFDVSSGILFYTQNFYFGASAKNLTTPSINYTGSNDLGNNLDLKFGAQIGGVLYLGPSHYSGERFYISPNLLFEIQGPFKQINGGIYAGKKRMYGGFFLRHTINNTDALIALIGVKSGIFKFGYSYDFTISGLNTAAGAHELSVTIDFGESPYLKKKIRQRGAAECPVIFQP